MTYHIDFYWLRIGVRCHIFSLNCESRERDQIANYWCEDIKKCMGVAVIPLHEGGYFSLFLSFFYYFHALTPPATAVHEVATSRAAAGRCLSRATSFPCLPRETIPSYDPIKKSNLVFNLNTNSSALQNSCVHDSCARVS